MFHVFEISFKTVILFVDWCIREWNMHTTVSTTMDADIVFRLHSKLLFSGTIHQEISSVGIIPMWGMLREELNWCE